MRKWIVKHQRSAAAAKRIGIAPATLLPVTVQAVSTAPATRGAAPASVIAIELHGARIELTGALDEQALRTVVRVITSAAAR